MFSLSHRLRPWFWLATASLAIHAQTEPVPERTVSISDCQFNSNPDEFLGRAARAQRLAAERTHRLQLALPTRGADRRAAVNPAGYPRVNFIDDEIFSRLQKAGLPAAPLSGDAEFLRRAMLDISGRVPSAQEIRDFIADTAADKRAVMIERLLYSAGYVNKWTQWLGDVLQNYAFTSVQSFSNEIEGRNRMHEWIQESIAFDRSWRDIAFQALASGGNNFDRGSGGVNFTVKAATPMGPAQDTYDMAMVKAATAFLGLGHYDCISCHNGAGHLNSVSAWGKQARREEAQRMAAFFSRLSLQRPFNNITADNPNYFYRNSTFVTDRATGQYDRNTTSGNRPARCGADGTVVNNRCSKTDSLTPRYRDGRTPPAGEPWRDAFAHLMADDQMFAINFANRVWKQMFNLALAEPVDGLDPFRLDPSNPPAIPWDFQASHPELLVRLARYARETDFSLRAMVRLIATSNAWQLSSRYDAEWNVEIAPLLPRHIARRMEGEEVHDAIVQATGVKPSYRVGGWADTVSWAMELPEPVEPRSDGTAAAFMNSFQRGNRDTAFRNPSGSVQMWMNMMNNTFVTNRTQLRNSPALAAMAKLGDEALVEEMFLSFLSRYPSEAERAAALKRLKGPFTTSYTRNSLVEDLAWVLINKTDFIFSY